MQRVNQRIVYLLLLVVCLLANASLVVFEHHKLNMTRREQIYSSSSVRLEKLHSVFDFGKIFNGRIKAFFAQIKGRDISAAKAIEKEWQLKNHLPAAACEFVYFNNFTPLNAPVDQFDDWQFLMTRFNCGRIRKFRTSGDVRNRLINLLNGGVGFERLEAKPGILSRLTIAGRRSYGIWFSESEKNRGEVTGLLAFFHEENISERMMSKVLLEKYALSTRNYGYVNLFQPEKSLVPDGFDSFAIAAQVGNFENKSGVAQIRMANRDILLNFKPDGRIFCCLLEDSPVALPFWPMALAFLWLPLCLRMYAGKGLNLSFSLHSLIIVLFIVSIALPLTATVTYWKSFVQSRMESGKIKAAHRLEKNLVQLDASFQEIFRTSERKFRELVKIINGRPENLQQFIDESIRLEVAGMFDTCLLVNAQGQFVRPYSGAGLQVRRLVFHRYDYREKVFDQFFRQGWVPFDLEAEYALFTPAENLDLEKFITLMPSQGKAALSSLASFAGKDLVNLHNNRLDGIKHSGKDDVSSMVMSSFVENEDESPVAKISQCLGDYVDFGFASNQSRNFVDLIKDKNGRAVYCAILFSGYYTYSFRFLDGVFTNKSRWPASVDYMALSEHLFQLSFPRLDYAQRMKWLLEKMQPPRNLHVEERRINGKDRLVCAYVGKNCPGYVFVATLPLEEIEKELTPLKQKLFMAAVLVFMALLIVWNRLKSMAIKPAAQIMSGVRALESRQHNHRIILETGDEWQQLGETFNVALEGLKELEVAHFVQTCILPAADIRAGNAVFAGKTVPADDVGGDYYDAFALSDNEMIFLMGDVSGHSVSAALVVSMARAAFAAIVDGGTRMPHEIFGQMNQLMLEHLRRAKMMTCFAGHIDAAGLLTCSNAGQVFPMIVDAAGQVETIRQVGYPLGVARKKSFAFLQMTLPARCRLIVCSDGVVEAANCNGEPFGYERLEKLIAGLGCSIPREEFFNGIYQAVREFSGEVPWADDVTVALLDYQRDFPG